MPPNQAYYKVKSTGWQLLSVWMLCIFMVLLCAWTVLKLKESYWPERGIVAISYGSAKIDS